MCCYQTRASSLQMPRQGGRRDWWNPAPKSLPETQYQGGCGRLLPTPPCTYFLLLFYSYSIIIFNIYKNVCYVRFCFEILIKQIRRIRRIKCMKMEKHTIKLIKVIITMSNIKTCFVTCLVYKGINVNTRYYVRGTQ